MHTILNNEQRKILPVTLGKNTSNLKNKQNIVYLSQQRDSSTANADMSQEAEKKHCVAIIQIRVASHKAHIKSGYQRRRCVTRRHDTLIISVRELAQYFLYIEN